MMVTTRTATRHLNGRSFGAGAAGRAPCGVADPRERAEMVARCQPLVRAVARRFIGPQLEIDDVVSVGNIGLVKALNRFDPQADHAIVWSPPQEFLDEQPGLKAMFNIGAGVDAIMKLRLPTQTLVVRLDDAGMSVQMAEYVCPAVIRHFREFDGYEADIAAGQWSYRKPRSRADWPVGVMGMGVLGERVAHALRVFEFSVHGWSRNPAFIPVRDYGIFIENVTTVSLAR